VPQNPHSVPVALSSAGFSRPWSPSSPTYVSPRLSPHGIAPAHRRMSQPYHPYQQQQSPTGMYPAYVMSGQWPQQQEITGTGFHHLLDNPPAVTGRQTRPVESSYVESPMIAPSNLAQRRLQRDGGFQYVAENQASPLQSPMTTPSDYTPTHDDPAYDKLLYSPLSTAAIQQQQSSQHTSPQLQSQNIPSHMLQNNYSQNPRPQSSHQSYLTHTQNHPRQYAGNSEFAVPRLRPNLSDAPTHPSSSSIATFSSSSTNYSTSTNHSYVSAHSALSSPNEPPPDFRNEYRLPSPYLKSEHTHSSNNSSRADLTPQTLADHTHVQESIHGQHVDATKEELKEVLPVENENDVGVIEYLDTLPSVITPRQ
jgi:hypothetical protein